jgi:YD repeat-containing protein
MPLCDRSDATYQNYVATLTSDTTCHVSWQYKNTGSSTWSNWSADVTISTCPSGWKVRPSPAAGCVPVDEQNYAQQCPTCQLGNPLLPLTGAKREVVPTGISLGGVALTLTYDTSSKAQPAGFVSPFAEPASFGPLWRTSFHHKLLVVGSSNPSASLSRGNGNILYFQGGSGGFTATGKVAHRLKQVTGGYLFSDVTNGTLEMFDTSGKLTTLTTAGGTVLTFLYGADGTLSAVQASDGRMVTFKYANGLISLVTGTDAGTITPAYDTQGNLASLTWADGKVFGFLYENASLPWALTGKVDENNSRLATFGYDASGRAISSEHAGGAQSYTLSYSTPPALLVSTDVYDATRDVWVRTLMWQAPGQITVSEPSGSTFAIDAQTVNGMPLVTGRTQAAGSGSAESSVARTYDGVGNVLSNDDASGVRTCYAYDSSYRETVRVEGLATSVNCASVLPAGSSLPAGARKITTSWHADWNMPTVVTEALKKTTIVYNGQPDPFNGNVTANCSSAPARADGKPAPVVCKQVEQALLPAVPGSVDSDFDKVSLLLHMGGANGARTIVDSARSPKTVTPAGDAQIATDQSRFGGSSLKFDGSGDYADVSSSADFAMGSGDFTVEFWVWTNPATAAWSRLLENEAYNTTGGWHFSYNGSDAAGSRRLGFQIGLNGGGGARIDSNAALPTSQWVHVAVTRAVGTVRMFVNGVQQSGTLATTENYTSQKMRIGATLGTASNFFTGYLDDLRITKGLARYTANFTPPPAQLPDAPDTRVVDTTVPTRVSSYTYDAAGRMLTSKDANNRTTNYAYYSDNAFAGPSDPDLGKVYLMLHGNGPNGSKAIGDSSLRNQPLTLLGDTSISTAQSMYGGSAIYFDGTGDYMTSPSSAGWNFGGGDFTIEAWIRPVVMPPSGYAGLVSKSRAAASYGEFAFGFGSNGGLQFAATTGGESSTGWTLTSVVSPTGLIVPGTWQHVAATRSGTTFRLFINGVQVGTTTASGAITNGTGNLSIGANKEDGSYIFNGWLDDVRVTVGKARYVASFTPPAAQLPDTGPDMNALGHTQGDLQTVTNAANQQVQYTLYDPAGHVRQMVDAKGITTDITYTPRGWVNTVTVTPPGGAGRATTYSYDNAGQMTGVLLPDGTSLGYGYDAAHRLTDITDTLGNSVHYTLDAAGNRTGEEVRDAGATLRRSIVRSFDALNRLQQVTGAAQ